MKIYLKSILLLTALLFNPLYAAASSDADTTQSRPSNLTVFKQAQTGDEGARLEFFTRYNNGNISKTFIKTHPVKELLQTIIKKKTSYMRLQGIKGTFHLSAALLLDDADRPKDFWKHVENEIEENKAWAHAIIGHREYKKGNMETAKEHLDKAIDGNIVYAFYRTAKMQKALVRASDGCEKNADEWYKYTENKRVIRSLTKRAAKLGSGRAMFLIAKDVGTKREDKITWSTQARDVDYSPALLFFAEDRQYDNPARLSCLKRAMEQGEEDISGLFQRLAPETSSDDSSLSDSGE